MSQPISDVLAELAWERFEVASARAARFLQGEQQDLFDTSRAEAREWLGIAIACDMESLNQAVRA